MQTAFTPENFQKAFKPYRIKFGIAYLIVICPVIIISLCISIPNWRFSQWLISVIMDTGAIYDGKTLHYGMFAIGTNLTNIIGIGVSVAGVFIGGVNVCGIVAIGVNTVGVIAVGTNAVGIVTIGVNTLGVIAIDLGGFGYGIYALSRTHRYKGKYLFAPHRQDPKAVALFTRWLPKLTESGIQDNNT
ncbi:hypothetical protein C6503_23320 [Candidatus Poribacteria bacterium]|nr:MAG: hypothetical protein C6503_23320 [Candidatus Poribacteria bacterium]